MTISSKKIYTNSERETFSLGKSMARSISPGVVVGFEGELGSGKTVLIKGILAGLGYDPKNVASASFVLVQEYKAKFPIIHMDLYRLTNKDEIFEIDWDGYFSKDNIVLIEWAEKVKDVLTLDVLVKIALLAEDKQRFIEIDTDNVKFLKEIVL
ncbi:MAG: tRNA (adenosine(37)-N6)-threonylcarbamoyltransferase complex ATPase subunit type 1 TsaE [Candidatus Kaelpia aquatica]|nr:tRNA (adenosine(37)-N6)-threonylcarbamoyltransferase complex ATPase subunit type 1 TsaE [Candidatus Kaelpia aquatica]